MQKICTLTYQHDQNEHDLLRYNNIAASLRWFLMKKLMLTGTAAYSDMFQKQQYILSKTSLAEPVYLFGDLRNKTVEITLDPEFSSLMNYHSNIMQVFSFQREIIRTSKESLILSPGITPGDFIFILILKLVTIPLIIPIPLMTSTRWNTILTIPTSISGSSVPILF